MGWHAPCVQLGLTPVRGLSREHAGGSFLGQWRPRADIDRRQAARRVSRQANQMRVAATARARITLEGNLPAVTDTGAVGCAFKTVSTTSRQRGLEDVRPSRWRKCARRVFGSR